ncbi:LysR substrate-binding domain-containing protein [Marinomonas balearica]|uniref:Transcriptional regulator n=1 Tax=Marinomonas balearica TaxID=491947 RepID=A0A4V3CGE5_9GAMM|nr:LysR substrate-binding domain-containing protein [Marinomonas balearica]TDO97392.1 transcriptional regulator [Marinomonas balearica]
MATRLAHLKAAHYFVVASETLSYTAAANKLSVSQAAVSQQIRLLEEYLGVSLFYRAGRKMLLTSQGKTLAEHLSVGFEKIEYGLNSVKLEPLAGNLTVYGLQSITSLWLMPKLWRFSDMHSDINVRLFSAEELPDLQSGDIDVSIYNVPILREDTENKILLTSPIVPICSRELFQRIGFNSIEDFLCCWLIQTNIPEYSWSQWGKEYGLTLAGKERLWAEVSSWYMGISAVKAGHGIFLCPEFMVQEELERGELVKPFDLPLSEPLSFYLAHSKQSPRLERINAFVKWIKQESEENIVTPYSPTKILSGSDPSQ